MCHRTGLCTARADPSFKMEMGVERIAAAANGAERLAAVNQVANLENGSGLEMGV